MASNRFIRCVCGGALNATRTMPSQDIDGVRCLAVRERRCDTCDCLFTTVEVLIESMFPLEEANA